MSKKAASLRYSLGIALMLIGMQFATALRNIFPSISIVNFVMAISFILLIDYQNLIKGKIDFRSYKNQVLFSIIVLMILFIINALVCNNTTYLFYHLYVICMCIAFLSHKNIQQDIVYLPNFICFLGGIISIVVLEQATLHFTNFSFNGYELTGKLWLDEGGDPITIPRALLITGIGFLFLNLKNKNIFFRLFHLIIKILFLLIIYLDLLAFSNRSSLLFLTLLILIYFLYRGIKCKNKAKAFFIFCFILLISFIFIFCIPFFQEKIISTFENTINALGTMFGKTGYNDASGANRFLTINYAFETLNSDSFWELLFGNGYMFRYIDVPILQIFVDLGSLVGVIYLILTIILPIIIILKSLSYKKTTVQLLIIFISIQYIFDQFYCGTPYIYFNFIYIILLVSILPLYHKKYNNFALNKQILNGGRL